MAGQRTHAGARTFGRASRREFLRTSAEVFASGGKVSMSSCFLPKPDNLGLELFSDGGSPKILSMTVYELKSAWTKAGQSRPADE